MDDLTTFRLNISKHRYWNIIKWWWCGPGGEVNENLHIIIVANPVLSKGNISSVWPRGNIRKLPYKLQKTRTKWMDINPNKTYYSGRSINISVT